MALVYLTCPSASGWKALEGAGWMCNWVMMEVQHQETNVAPQSETIWSGNPCNLQTEKRNWRAGFPVSQDSFAGINWAALVRWSTTTMIESKEEDRGNFTMKSTPIVDHGLSGIGKRTSSPWVQRWSTFICWHLAQEEIYVKTPERIFGQEKVHEMRSRVQKKPQWPLAGSLWNLPMRKFWEQTGTYNQSFHHQRLSFSVRKLLTPSRIRGSETYNSCTQCKIKWSVGMKEMSGGNFCVVVRDKVQISKSSVWTDWKISRTTFLSKYFPAT